MELKFKEVNPVEEKSVQEVEEKLLKKHEEENKEPEKVEETSAEKTETVEVEKPAVEQEPEPSSEVESPTIKDEDVLSYIKNRYNKDISSVDDLFTQQKENEPLPEDVSKYLDFKKNTGRGFEDFVKANRDFTKLSDDQILREYYSMTESDLDSEDIQYLIDDKFSYDEELEDQKEIKKKNIAKKREISKAKKYLNELKETYSIPLESSGGSIPKETLEELQAYRNYVQQSKTMQEANQKKNEYFLKQTDKVFHPEFKGFEFEIGDKKVSYAYGDAQEMRSKQLNLESFINKYVGEDGLISDAVGWHTALSAAMNPQKFAQYFYEQGKADAIGDVTKKSKNINMNVRQTPQAIGDTGFKARPISDTSGRGLKIRSKKK
tara:strand:- start:1624 stop:2757 length:1134 start_codon:yes stop_codon:yes gene_type:complete